MEVKEIIKKIINANIQYRLGNPSLTDQEYDQLVSLVKNQKEFKDIEHFLNEGRGDKKHQFIIGSLLKLKRGEDNDIKNFDNSHIEDTQQWIITPKFDGASITVYYNNGQLLDICTRGDGYYGKSVLNKLKTIIPSFISNTTGLVGIRGELIITDLDFIELNKNTNNKYNKHPRNAIVGMLNEKKKNNIDCYASFYAYRVLGNTFKNYLGELKFLKENQFNIPFYTLLNQGKLGTTCLMEVYHDFLNKVNYAIDGLVIQSNENNIVENEYYPNNARAFKANEIAIESEIVDVKFDVSKDNKLVPIIYIKPKELSGSTITKVTGCNYSYIKSKGLGIGAKVLIQKKGEIIPFISEVIEYSNDFTYIPETCPVCGSPIITMGKQLYCSNPNCKHAITKSVAFFLKNLGVEECSEKSLRNWNIVSLDDLLDFVPERSSKQQTKLISELNTKLFPITDEKLILSFDYSGVGEKLIKKIIKANSCEDFIGVFFGDEDKPLNIPTGITENTFNRISKAIKNNKLDKFYNRLISDDRWIKFNDERERIKRKNQVESSKELAGKSFCFTGALSISRNFATELVEKLGGDVKSSVSGGLTYLVTENANSGSTKAKKARQLGTTVLGEKEFFDIVHYDPNKGRQVESDDIDNL